MKKLTDSCKTCEHMGCPEITMPCIKCRFLHDDYRIYYHIPVKDSLVENKYQKMWEELKNTIATDYLKKVHRINCEHKFLNLYETMQSIQEKYKCKTQD